MADTAVLNLGLNSRSYERNLNRVDTRTERFGRSVTRTSSLVTGVLTGALAVASWHMIKLASDAEETGSKFNTIFKNIEKSAGDVADSFAKDFGLASSSSQKLLGNTGDLLTGLGFTQAGALDLSYQVNKLAVDLASFTNFSGGAEGASNALTKALLGERESIKSLGISIQEKDVKAQMAIDKTNGLTFATEKQAKAQATLTIALRQSKNAIGDYARTSDSTANRIKLMSQRWLELQENVGKFLIEGLQVDKVLETISKGMHGLTQDTHTLKLAITSINTNFSSSIAKAGINAQGFFRDSIDGYKFLWAKATGSTADVNRLKASFKWEASQRKAMIDGVDSYRKKTLDNAYKEWNTSEDKKLKKTKANADTAIKKAKEIEEASGIKPEGEKNESKSKSASTQNTQFSNAVEKGTIDALKLESQTSDKIQNKQLKALEKIESNTSSSSNITVEVTD